MSKSFLFNFRRIHNLLNDESVVSFITLGVSFTGILGHFCYTFGMINESELIYEYIEGQSLYDYIKSEHFSFETYLKKNQKLKLTLMWI